MSKLIPGYYYDEFGDDFFIVYPDGKIESWADIVFVAGGPERNHVWCEINAQYFWDYEYSAEDTIFLGEL